jgi:hypothetical protein
MSVGGDLHWFPIALSGALALGCMLHLWFFQPGSLWRKAFWSVAVWLPGLGPFFYATCYRVPPKKPDSEIPETGFQY